MTTKKTLGIRIDGDMYARMEKLAESTGKTIGELGREAIAQYLGLEVETVEDRLVTLEREVADLRGKLKALAA